MSVTLACVGDTRGGIFLDRTITWGDFVPVSTLLYKILLHTGHLHMVLIPFDRLPLWNTSRDKYRLFGVDPSYTFEIRVCISRDAIDSWVSPNTCFIIP